jgi:hypothetical protein
MISLQLQVYNTFDLSWYFRLAILTGERLEEEALVHYEGPKQASYLCALNKVREQIQVI